MQALSLDLRQRIVAALAAGDKRTHIATRFAVSESSVYRLHRQWKSQGDLSPKKRPGRGHALKDEDLPTLETLVQQQADPTGASLVEAWKEVSGNTIGLSTMHRALHRLKLSFKKNAARPASGTKPGEKPSGKR
jgi:transposase